MAPRTGGKGGEFGRLGTIRSSLMADLLYLRSSGWAFFRIRGSVCRRTPNLMRAETAVCEEGVKGAKTTQLGSPQTSDSVAIEEGTLCSLAVQFRRSSR